MTYKQVLDYFREDKVHNIALYNRPYKRFIRLLIDHMWRD